MGKTLLNYLTSRELKSLSLNLRGLRNVNKRRAIFSYLKSQKATIFCLQETYFSIEDEKVGLQNGVAKFVSRMALRTREAFAFL